MNEESIQLVSPSDPGYIITARRNARRKRVMKSRFQRGHINQQSNNLINNDTLKNQEITLWENTLRILLSQSVNEYTERILRYRERNRLSFREIDFVGQINSSLIFVEMKFKDNLVKKDGYYKVKAKGWLQVKRSYDLACKKYHLLDPLLIIIDMSFALGIQDETNKETYLFNSINNFRSDLCNPQGIDKLSLSQSTAYKNESVRFLLFNSSELFEIARERGLLNDSDLNRLKDIYVNAQSEQELPAEFFSSKVEKDISDSPFNALKELKNKDKLH